MEMVLLLRPICSQNILVHHRIQSQPPLKDHVDEYDARCVGTLELSMLSSRRLSVVRVRQELATREHMLDHGQLGSATPVNSPIGSHHTHTLRSTSHTLMDSTSALNIEDESDIKSNTFLANSSSTEPDLNKEDVSIDAAHILGLQLSDAAVSSVTDGKVQPHTHTFISSDLPSYPYIYSQILATLRSTSSPVSPISVNSPPIILNAKCSGNLYVQECIASTIIPPFLILGHSYIFIYR